MAQHVTRALCAPGWRVVECRPGKATIVARESGIVRLEVAARRGASSPVVRGLVTARLLGSGRATRDHAEGMAALADRVGDRPGLEPFSRLVGVVDGLRATLAVYPVDPELPTLVDASDPERVGPLLGDALATSVTGVEVELGHYGRRHRCVLRYRCSTTSGPDGARTVFGKVACDDRGQAATEGARALAEAIRRAGEPGVTVPDPLGYDPGLRLALFDEVRGRPLLGGLLEGSVVGLPPLPGAPSLEGALDDAARLLALLHRVPAGPGPRRDAGAELDAVAASVAPLLPLVPGLAARLDGRLVGAGHGLVAAPEAPEVMCHGDFSPGQLLFGPGGCAVVDLDTICRGDPALDLGHFLAYLRLGLLKAAPDAATAARAGRRLGDRFLDSYARAAGGAGAAGLRDRAARYETVSLVRLAVHSWLKLKTSRLRRVLALLEDSFSRSPSRPLI
jgi:hypothetical protein